jgi:hypothetical protein
MLMLYRYVRRAKFWCLSLDIDVDGGWWMVEGSCSRYDSRRYGQLANLARQVLGRLHLHENINSYLIDPRIPLQDYCASHREATEKRGVEP